MGNARARNQVFKPASRRVNVLKAHDVILSATKAFLGGVVVGVEADGQVERSLVALNTRATPFGVWSDSDAVQSNLNRIRAYFGRGCGVAKALPIW